MKLLVIALVLIPSLASAAPATSWDFPAERIVRGWDGSGQTREVTHGTVHCDLADAHTRGGITTATVTCSGMPNVQQITGDYVLPARRGKPTCVRHDLTGPGDEAGWQLCLTATGIVGGSAYSAGGQTDDTYFGDVPRD